MKWLRIIFALFLIIGMLLCVSAVAYAEEGDENSPANGEETNPGEGDNPGSSLEVDIFIQGDNPNVTVGVDGDNSEVGVDLYGDDNTAEVNFHSENPTVLINGQNLNKPTAVYNVQNYSSYSGASSMGVRRLVKDVMFPYMNDIWAGLNLTAEGLAKVILLAQYNESDIAEIYLKVGNHIPTRLDAQEIRLTTLESESASLAGQIETLEAQDEAIKTYIVAYGDYLRTDYNRKLITIIGAFSLVVIGLAIGLGVLWRRTRAL